MINYTDGYKLGHKEQYPEGTELVYSNWTARSGRNGETEVVFFGLQYIIKKYLIPFVSTITKEEIAEHKKFVEGYLGIDYDVKHWGELRELGHLPIQIDAVPEGTVMPTGVPMMVIFNTDKRFYWLVNYLETLISCNLWMPCTSASTARVYKQLTDYYANITGAINTDFQCHDFSMRGMSSLESAVLSGMAHLTAFKGSDTLPAIKAVEKYYNTKDVAYSVPATEHSVMCMGGKETEIETFRRIMKTYPMGIVSIVSDTWDFWKVIEETLPELKDEIMKRDGKLVIRPDSGNPGRIICGDPLESGAAEKGLIEALWDEFGGTINDKGYKVLDSHIGAIYGDAITPARADEILERLELKGFCSSNIVFGIGSYSYQYKTRDNYNFAIKATYGIINGEPIDIEKTPKTDMKKKSAKGRVRAIKHNGVITTSLEDNGFMQTVFKDGKLIKEYNLTQIRDAIHKI